MPEEPVVESMTKDLAVQFHGKRTIVPIEPSEPLIVEVSKLDSMMGNFYLHYVYFFRAPFEQSLDALNESLSFALFKFPVMSGRLRLLNDANLGIKLNDAGLRSHEATSSWSIDDWIENSKQSESIKLLCPSEAIHISDYSISPLVLMQLTKFRCGGMAIGVSWCHILGDFASMSRFINIWGDLHARRNRDAKIQVDDAPTSNGVHHALCDHREDAKLKIMEDVFRAHATSEAIKPASLFETRIFHIGLGNPEEDDDAQALLCAQLWKSIAKARDIPVGDATRFVIWMDDPHQCAQHRQQGAFFGNSGLAFHSLSAVAGDLVTQRDEQVAKMIQKGLAPATAVKNGSTGRNGSTGPATALKNGSTGVAAACSSQNVVFCCWAAPVRPGDVDFGLARKPVLVDCAAASLFGEAIVSVVGDCVAVSLRSDVMKRFLQDAAFLTPA